MSTEKPSQPIDEELSSAIRINLKMQNDIKTRIYTFAGVSLTRNMQKRRARLRKELAGLKEKYKEMIKKAEEENRLSREEYVVLGVLPVKVGGPNGYFKYITQYEAIWNDPVAFLNNPGTLIKLGLFPDKTEEEVRKILYKQQLHNNTLRKNRRERGINDEDEEEEEEEEKEEEEKKDN